VDGDVTDRVIRTEREDSILYMVCDSAGNTARVERTLHFEHSKPEFSGQLYTSYLTPTTYADYPGGLKCTDGWGNDISDLIQCRGGTKPVPGSYTLAYYVTDEDGNDVVFKVPIEVKMGTLKYDPSKADPNKVIYLTYDDGPSVYTSKLLDILDMYGVKATFFVTGNRPGYFHMIGEENRRGHKIAAHTFTHEYDIVYASEEAYFDDLDKIEAVIHDQTGEYTKLIRFPGGSSNTVSRFNPGIMSRLVKAVAERGYRYFDWSVSSGDGRSVLSTQEVFERVKKGVSGHSVSVVLQHDTKLWSIEAVPMIIEWGIINGYTFAVLDENSYQAAHHLNN
jgi:peptidoglycan/xylan/chitin deacetylase (PgdA/CDA1 family)